MIRRDSDNNRGSIAVSRDSMPAFFACAIGFFSTFAVAYITKIGNTVVPLVYVFSILCLLLGGYKLANGKHLDCDKSIIAFSCWAGISCVFTLAYCMRGDFDSYALTVPARGYLVLLCGITMYLSASSVWSEKKWLFVGLAAGVLLNFVFSLLSLWAFNNGTYFNLYSVFPQNYYQMPLKYEYWASNTGSFITEYRPQGLFLECSHLMLFLVCILPIVFFETKNTTVKVLLCVFGVFATVTSKSPNTVIFVCELLVLWLLLRKKGYAFAEKKRVRLSGTIWLFLFVVLIGTVGFFAVKPDLFSSVISQLEVALADFNVSSSTDGGTTERWRNMQLAASLLGEYPLGAGWNMETYVMEHNFVGNVASSHTVALKYLLEIGPLGLGLYVYLICRHCVPLLSKKSTSFQKILGVSVLFLFIGQVTNGVSLAPWMWLLLGMAHAEIRNLPAKFISDETTYGEDGVIYGR